MVSDELAGWIGREVVRDDLATPRLLAEYRAGLGPWLFDPGAGAAPPGFHWGLAPATPGQDQTAADGSEAPGALLPPLPYPHRMWAGGRIETLAPIRAGAAVRRRSRLANLEERQGASGPLCFTTISHEIESDGQVAIRERQMLVFRSAGTGPAAGQAAPDTKARITWEIEATALLLFRFSAFTFNGHRIHYDEPYCRAEGYDGLLVHGPLQAALMLNQLSQLASRVPALFDYRCLAPLTAGRAFTVATGVDGVARVIRADGVVTAEGRGPAPGT